MRFRIFLGLCCLGLPAVVLSRAGPQETGQPPKDAQSAKDLTKVEFARDVVPFLAKYCTDCHGGAKPKSGLDLSKFKDMAAASQQKLVWERVVDQLRAGEMPPTGKPRPSLEQADRITKWMSEQMLAFDCSKQRDPGRVTFRRLNKNEYNNTVRDLLGVRFKPADDFPSDDVADVFDNNGDILTMSPLLMEKYFAAAQKIVEEVFWNPELKKKIITVKLPAEKIVDTQPAGKLGGKGVAGKGPPGKGPPPAKFDEKERETAFKAIMEPFLRRAYRRPIAADELARFQRFLQITDKDGDLFEKSIQLAMQAALCSSHFLFRVEKDFPIKGDVIAQPIGPHELACRLSYFLWSSMPDEELFAVADKGTIRDQAVLEMQVRRMLKDPKAQALTENFAGQWLQLRTMLHMTPDPNLFPKFDAVLRQAMVKETELFFDCLLKEDRSILEFLDADWTFVNERLATHYDIKGVKGEEFQKVKLPSDQRAGVLTHASILSVSSNPTRTSPVKRGKWILDNILNTPPPPPPPDAGALSEDEKDTSAAPLRQRLEQHRRNAVCASCHQKMDPLGFGFENFDAIGAWRTKDGKFDVDAAGELPGGQKFSGPKELVALLKQKEPVFRRCLVEKLLTYGLGRGLHYYDRCAVDDICAEVARNDNRMVSMVLSIVRSDPFQMKKGRQP